MKYVINLLTQKETPVAEQLMYFSLNYLRYIIIITQLVVIGVFFYRFQVDQRIIDLKESVDQKKEIIQVVTPLLNEADIISQRTKESKLIIAEQNRFSQTIDYFLSQFPESVSLKEFKLEGDSITVSGTTIDLTQLQAFFTLLKNDNKFKSIDLQNIRKTETGYGFDLKLINFKAS